MNKFTSKKISSWVLKVTLLLPICAMASGCMPHTVGSTEVGVRVKKISLLGNAGVVDKHYGPGTYFFLPVVNDWYVFDTSIQKLTMTRNRDTGDLRTRDDLLLKTIDGNDISLDVTIQYRLNPAKVGQLLQYVGANNTVIKNKILRTVVRSIPRDIFGELRTEEFYVSSRRSAKAQEVLKVLNAILGPMGIIVDNVLSGDYRFNPAYEQAIKDKKIADQQVKQNIAKTNAAREEYKKRLEDAYGEVNQMVAKVDGEFLQAKIKADAYLKQQQIIAQAILVEAEAEAKAIEEMNKALASQGGVTMVKLRLAEALKGKKIVIMPFNESGLDVKSTNINRLFDLYGVKTLSKEGQRSHY